MASHSENSSEENIDQSSLCTDSEDEIKVSFSVLERLKDTLKLIKNL